MQNIFEIIFHIDKHLNVLIQACGGWSYLVLFMIIFAETGLVVTPFLPGDSLLFAVGTFAAIGAFDILWLFIILAAAAIIGDSINYAIGKFFGEKAFQNSNSRIFKKEYLDKTHRFYEKYGAKTIILARFVPIVRTFAPFVAGVGRMTYFRFFIYNVTGALLWVSVFVLGGYFFGNIPLIKENFSIVVIIIILASVLPVAIEFWRHQKAKIAQFFKKIYLKLFLINDTPQKIAMGFGLGVFLGVLPVTGPIAALTLAVILRINRASALVGSILTNTWLSIPVFLLAVKTGSLVTGSNAGSIRDGWAALLKNFSWAKLLQVSAGEIVLPVITGYLIVSFCMAVLAYVSAFIIVKYRRKN